MSSTGKQLASVAVLTDKQSARLTGQWSSHDGSVRTARIQVHGQF